MYSDEICTEQLNFEAPSKSGYEFNGYNIQAGNDLDILDENGNWVGQPYNENSGDIRINAKWTQLPDIPQITLDFINFDEDGGKNGTEVIYCLDDTELYLDSSLTIKMEVGENPLTIPEKNGFIFDGYYLTNEDESIDEEKQLINSSGYVTELFYDTPSICYNKIIKAKWTQIPIAPETTIVSIQLNKDGGVNGTNEIYCENDTNLYLDQKMTKKMEVNKNELIIPEKDGYTFGGYYLAKEDGSIDEEKQLINASGYVTELFYNNPDISSDKRIKAKWIGTGLDPETPENTSFEIQLNKNGGNSGTDTIYYNNNYIYYLTEDDDIINMEVNKNPLAIPEKEGYEFEGYYLAKQDGSLDEEKQMINEEGFLTEVFYNNPEYSQNKTLKAKWTKKNNNEDNNKLKINITKKKLDNGKVAVIIEVDSTEISKVEVKNKNDSKYTDITNSLSGGKYGFSTPTNGTYSIKVTTRDGKVYEEEFKVTEISEDNQEDNQGGNQGANQDGNQSGNQGGSQSGNQKNYTSGAKEDNSKLTNSIPYAGKVSILPTMIFLSIMTSFGIYLNKKGVKIIIKKD